MNSIGINPNVATITPKVNFQGVTGIAGKRPDINETINTFKNSNLGQFVIEKVKSAVKFVSENLKKEGGIKNIFNAVKDICVNFSKKGIVKKGVEFVKNTFTQLAENKSIKNIISSVVNVFKKASKTA